MKILIFTSSRAEYGLLSNLVKLFSKSKTIKLNTIISGSHLSKKHGYTINEIIKDKIKINKKISLSYSKDTNEEIANNINKINRELTKYFKKNSVDLMVVLGDRYEVFAASVAALFNNIKIAHLHGGERSEGSLDEILRHSITKMSYYHFVATKEYERRVIQLGENPKNVFKVGALCNDNINNFIPVSKSNLENSIKFKFKNRNILVTLHPETMKSYNMSKKIDNLLNTLEKYKDLGIIFTYPNSDKGNLLIIKKIQNFVKKNSNSKFYKSLGLHNYLNCLYYSDGILGNTSSGIIEAPLMCKGSVNVGERQKGRILSSSVINSNFKKKNINKSLKKLLSNNFQKKIKKVKSPYYGKGVSKKIFNHLRKKKNLNIRLKNFFDLKK